MTVETTTPAVETVASTVAQPAEIHYTKGVGAGTTHVKAAKKSIKSVAKKAVKPVAKKTAAKKAVVTRTQHIFILSPKADLANFGTGQRLAIAKLIKKGATRADLIAKLPDTRPESIGWHLSMMVKDDEAKKVAAK